MDDIDIPDRDARQIYSQEAEISVLGACFIDNDVVGKVLNTVQPEYFFRDQNRMVFSAMRKLYENGDEIDTVTLSDQLKGEGKLGDAGGVQYLAQLIDAVPTSANVENHIKILRNRYLQRRLVSEAGNIIRNAYTAEPSEVDDVIDDAQNRIFKVNEDAGQKELVDAPSILRETMDEISKRIDQDGEIIGVTTGIKRLDSNTGGFKPSEYILIAGRPSMGKTSLATNIASHAALEQDVPTAIFSLEMSKQEVMRRMLAAQGKVNVMRIANGELNEREMERLSEAANKLNESPIFVDDSPGLNILELRAKLRRAKKEHDIGLAVVDYLQLMEGTVGRDQRRLQIGEISRGMKKIARELDIPLVTLSQLSRAPEKRTDHKPRLSDLRESGDLEQDADIVLFVYRREMYEGPTSDEGEDLRNKATIVIGKQRNGPTGDIRNLNFVKEFTLFKED